MRSKAARHCSERFRAAPGLTLIEMLVVIATIALLIAIILPAIGKSRAAGRASVSMANARTLTQVIHQYADIYRDTLPALAPDTAYPAFNRDISFIVPYWQVANMWTGVVFDLLPYNENVAVYLSPGSPRRHSFDLVWPTSYHYSMSFVGDPLIWSPVPTPNPLWMSPRKLSGALYPSQKTMLWDNEVGFSPNASRSTTGDLFINTPVAMADVSVSMRNPSEAVAAFPNPFPAPGGSMRLHNTPLGIRGVDFGRAE